MEQQRYLIDSNTVIDYLGGKLPAAGSSFMHTVINAIPVLSIITKIEVLGYPVPEEHQQTLVGFINDSIVLALSNEIADKCITIRKVQKIKLPDAIDGLKIINPHKIELRLK